MRRNKDYIIEDEREEGSEPLYYMVGTDDFLSGWGKAPNRSLYAFAVHNEKEGEAVEIAMKKNDDLKRVRTCGVRVEVNGVKGLPSCGLEDGDHLKIVDARSAYEFTRGQAAFT